MSDTVVEITQEDLCRWMGELYIEMKKWQKAAMEMDRRLNPPPAPPGGTDD